MKKIVLFILLVFALLGCNNGTPQKEPYQEVIADYSSKFNDIRPEANIYSEKEVVAGLLEDIYTRSWDEVEKYKQKDPDWESVEIGQVTLVENLNGDSYYYVNAVKNGYDVVEGISNAKVGDKITVGDRSAINYFDGEFAPSKTLTKQEAIDLAKTETGATGDAIAKAILTPIPNYGGAYSWGWAVQFSTRSNSYWVNSRIYDPQYFNKNKINNDSLKSQVLIGELSANVFDKPKSIGPLTVKPIKYCKE